MTNPNRATFCFLRRGRLLLNTVMVRRLCLIVALLVGGLLAGAAYAETFKLANGETITGELLAGVGE